MPFAYLESWAYYKEPWRYSEELLEANRFYTKLRYRLLPYLYSSAAEAAATGYPVMRAMALAYPDDPAWDTARTQYMLGDFFLVSAFSKDVRLPPGVWIDYFTGQRHTGPATLPVTVTESVGGALLVKQGAIIPTWPACNHAAQGWSAEVGLSVYPGASSTFTLHEDDGQTLGYRKGQFARTRLTCETVGKKVRLTVGAREGRYAGMPATRDFTATLHLTAQPGRVTLDGRTAECVWDAAAGTATVKVPGCGATARLVECE